MILTPRAADHAPSHDVPYVFHTPTTASASDSAPKHLDWLEHEWAFKIRTIKLLGREGFQVVAEAHPLHACRDRSKAEQWVAEHRRACLAELIARGRQLHPALVTIVAAGTRRLGRIRPELWGSYDALPLLVTNHRMSILSAKARAAFRDEPDVLVHVMHDDAPRR